MIGMGIPESYEGVEAAKVLPLCYFAKPLADMRTSELHYPTGTEKPVLLVVEKDDWDIHQRHVPEYQIWVI